MDAGFQRKDIVFAPQQVYYSKIENNAVTICAPTTKIENKGSTLGGINLTIKITSPAVEVLRVQTAHYLGELKKSPEFELNYAEISMETEETEEAIIVKSGSLSLEITKATCAMTYKRNGEVVTKSKNKISCTGKNRLERSCL